MLKIKENTKIESKNLRKLQFNKCYYEFIELCIINGIPNIWRMKNER